MTEKELERFDPAAELGRISYEHFHRYALCREHVEGKRVLDLASGAGYGTALLAQRAAHVVGIDIDPAAVREAQKRYRLANVEFVVADCFDLPFDDASFDVVVANEMIEHVEDHNRLINEIKRVLRPAGFLLVSTPNKPIYNRYKPPNRFHVAEMDIAEFSRLLNRHFAHVGMTGLRMGLMSVGFRMGRSEDRNNLPGALTYLGDFRDPRSPQVKADELWLHEPEYVLALCSDEAVEAGPGGPSLFVSRDEDLWLEHEKIMAWASGLHAEDVGLRNELARAQADLQTERDQVQHVREDYTKLDERFSELKRMADASSEAIVAHRDAMDRIGAEHFAMSSRLLSRMTGHGIEPNGQSVIEALFVLNETITEQRARIAEIPSLESRLASAEANQAALRQEVTYQTTRIAGISEELDRSRDSNGALTSRLTHAEQSREEAEAACIAAMEATARSEATLSGARAEIDQVVIENGHVRGELTRALEEVAKLASDLQATHERSQALAAENDTIKEQTKELQSLQDQLQVELAQAREETAALASDLSVARSANATAVTSVEDIRAIAEPPHITAPSPLVSAPTATGSWLSRGHVGAAKGTGLTVPLADSGTPRELERFVKLHQSINGQLARASRDIAGRIVPAPLQPWQLKRWIKHRNPYAAPFRTILFDSNWITEQAPDIGRISLARYLRDDRMWSLDPHPVFSSASYLGASPDVAAASINPLRHYREHGWREGRNPHPYFANDWYLAQNPDVLTSSSISPLEHYLEHGWREGRWPNPLFNPRAYLDRYPDVAAARVEPLTHFLAYGRQEGRELPLSSVNPVWTSLLPADAKNKNLFDFLLQEKPLAATGTSDAGSPPQDAGRSWPPERLNDYWVSQRLRDFIIEGYGEDAIHVYSYLCSVMAAFELGKDEFAQSAPCRQIIERLKIMSRARAVDLPTFPDASIVIPVYNNIIDTLLCICSILESDTRRTYEILVADDGSSDATAQLVTEIGGVVRYIRQPRNFGFVGNCNAAAKQAGGEHIILLNNDTLVMPNWLDPLLETFTLHEKVGLSGSKLINSDGTLQEAGGIYWQDGSAWNFGRGGDARAPEFNYLKDVDYVSGAAIAVPTAIWREMGGFDEIYAPAYCEDADFAFRLREAGYRTILNPQSECLHHEGRSHGRDLTAGIKAYQVINQKTFLSRWRDILQRDHYLNGENVLRARDRSGRRKHVLVIDHYVPQWDQDAGSRSTFMCIQGFLELGYAVTFWPDNLWRDPHYTPLLQERGVEVIYGGEYLNGFDHFIKSRNQLYDAVFLNRPQVAQKYLESLRKNTNSRILYYGHDLHFKRMTAALAAGEPVAETDIAAIRKMEFDVCRKVDAVLYPDPEEVRLVQHEVGGDRAFAALPVFAFSREVFARGVRILERVRSKTAYRLLFVGGFNHTPNRDGIHWFLDNVFPELQRRLGHVHLTIVGSKPPESITGLASDTITVAGFVSDERLAQLYDEASVVIAPLRYGAGVKGKVIEALAMGVPLVTTAVGAQGIDNADDLLFMANDSEAFANGVARALTDREEAWTRAKRGLEFVDRHYSTDVLQNLLSSLIEGHGAGNAPGVR